MARLNRMLQLGTLSVALAACATSPLGRQQFLMMSASDMDKMGVAAYDQLKQETPISSNKAQTAYVRCIADHITAVLDGDQKWEVNLFQDDTANAFALPGGKIGIHTGLLKVAVNQDQVAAVMGHEVGHVLAQHSNERVSIQSATQSGLQLIAAISGDPSPMKNSLMGLLGVGAQVGVALPFSRKHETEADVIGLQLMAKAGFNPAESVTLWQNMAAASGGGGGPQFLSTHPSSASRIRELQSQLASVMPDYQQARAAGRVPSCKY
ncbi:M48 family metallopeptidase [Isoalcanivorax beigongshangi]|uniref:M48 family metallopeptidase n=1 Tax=Isoalcanivorax beigongshangi TaxID=3238810 RepID=A0ABV4AGS0_9GAMM